jgi:hypothetical protein
MMALWDSPRQREAYTWFAAELANLRTAFRWAADHGDLDAAATIASYAGLLGLGIENYEPVAWAEELIDPAGQVGHHRLANLYVIASLCWMAGRIEDAIRYAEIGQTVLADSPHTPPYGVEGWLGRRISLLGNLSGGRSCAALSSNDDTTTTFTSGRAGSSGWPSPVWLMRRRPTPED